MTDDRNLSFSLSLHKTSHLFCRPDKVLMCYCLCVLLSAALSPLSSYSRAVSPLSVTFLLLLFLSSFLLLESALSAHFYSPHLSISAVDVLITPSVLASLCLCLVSFEILMTLQSKYPINVHVRKTNQCGAQSKISTSLRIINNS